MATLYGEAATESELPGLTPGEEVVAV